MNRRGLSQIVTTVLIIIVVLAAVVLVWAAVRGIIIGATDQFTSECITIGLEAESCDKDADTVRVSRSSGAGVLTGVKFIFDDGSVADWPTGEPFLDPLEERTINVTVPDAATSVNVAAVVGEGNICPESSAAPVDCTSGIAPTA